MMALLATAFGFAKGKWLPLVLIFSLISGAAVWLRSSGYKKGVKVTEAKVQKRLNKALATQLVELKRINALDVDTALLAAQLEFEVIDDVDAIPIPNLELFRCPEPHTVEIVTEGATVFVDRDPTDYAEWLRFFNAAVRASKAAGP